jgi:hypothetical protein
MTTEIFGADSGATPFLRVSQRVREVTLLRAPRDSVPDSGLCVPAGRIA